MNIGYFKKKLEEEKKEIEAKLASISVKNPANKDDWEAVPTKDVDEREPDLNEAADNIEDYETSYSLNDVLEKRLNEVKDALASIEKGNYGVCKIGGEDHLIESERLEANPAAKTCIKHLEE